MYLILIVVDSQYFISRTSTRDWRAYNKPRVNIALAIGTVEGDWGSDMMISDLVIFDRVLSDAEVETVSKLIQEQPRKSCLFFVIHSP